MGIVPCMGREKKSKKKCIDKNPDSVEVRQ